MWQKNKDLKQKFVDECSILIQKNQLRADIDFVQFQKIFEEDKGRKDLYHKLLIEDKEFIH